MAEPFVDLSPDVYVYDRMIHPDVSPDRPAHSPDPRRYLGQVAGRHDSNEPDIRLHRYESEQ
jgi:hypothetical protein